MVGMEQLRYISLSWGPLDTFCSINAESNKGVEYRLFNIVHLSLLYIVVNDFLFFSLNKSDFIKRFNSWVSSEKYQNKQNSKYVDFLNKFGLKFINVPRSIE